jgi:hypothetical protein
MSLPSIASVPSIRCTLEVGAHEVVVAEDGTLLAEYALVDLGDIELHSTEPGTNREAAYRTTASRARARLADRGITAAIADEVAQAMRPGVARAYARGTAVRCIADHLGPAELLEGQTFDPATGLYAGAWLDLPALAADLGMTGAAGLMQSLHLAALLADQPDDLPVSILTAQITAGRRPGERTFRRVSLAPPTELVRALRALGSSASRSRVSIGPNRPEVTERLRARAARTPSLRSLLATLEDALAAREQPATGPLADGELWAIETRLSRGDAQGVLDELDGLEKRRGRLPGTAYLRARIELLTPTQEPRDLAERVSALSTSMPAFHELALLAAQAWAAVGDARQANAFARDLMGNATAADALRLQALHVLEERPPSLNPRLAPREAAPARSNPSIPRSPQAPSGIGTDYEPLPETWVGPMPATATRSNRPPAISASESLAWSNRPTQRALAQTSAVTAPPSQVVTPEVEALETLSLPIGMQGTPAPPPDEPPRTPAAARLAFTFLTRDLGRELRLRHTVEPCLDTDGLEMTQRYLREKLPEGRVRNREDERELLRHGAFLSELLARRLGAQWIDLDSNDSARWAMVISPASGTLREPIRAWPFARALRFVGMGHKERDLVSYYLELEGRARQL